MNKSKSFLMKVIAVFLLISIVNSIVFPTCCWALTSFDTQPEIQGYQPVDATDNVGLTSGGFNYTIPVTSIPEFPMAIGYSAGMGMEAEGSVYGFGFNGFSGAIARNMMGLPDDLKSGSKKYEYSNQKRWDASVKGTVSTSFVPAVGFGGSVSLQVGYNNYKGAYGALGIGLGLSAKLGTNRIAPAGGLGISLISDSRESGIKFGAGAAVGISAKLYGSANGFEGLGNASVGKTLDNKASKWSSAASLVTSIGKSVFPQTSSTSASSLAPLSYVLPTNTGFGASLTVPINANISVTGAYSQFNFGAGEIKKEGYGFLYLDHYSNEVRNNKSNTKAIADMTIEGEDSHNPKAYNAPSYMQRDYFAVNTMGMSGTMQLYQPKYGNAFRNYARDQFRQFGLLGVKTERKEVAPWTNVSQTKINKGVDIMALLKKKDNADEKDFDKAMFDEEERVSLVEPEHSFGRAVFKMRGDMAGEFDLSSKDFDDHGINKYDLTHISGTGGDPRFKFLGQEKDMPLYYPSAAGEDQADYNKGAAALIERSTNIKYSTVGDITSAYSALKTINPNAGDVTAFNFNQSFYSHYKYYNTTSPTKDQMVKLNDHQVNMNILTHLQSLQNSKQTTKDMIGAIEMQTTSGLRYFFNLPAFNKTKKTIQLSGKGEDAPEISGSQYRSFDGKDRGKVTVTDDYTYPYAWLLTAVVGDDYIDFDNIPGPSDGDIGYWVKFKYVLAAEDYRWRAPFNSLNHLPGAIHNPEDDAYVATTGTKEIYYLSEIESSNYVCKYTMYKRYDAYEANGEVNGEAYNSLKENRAALPSTDLTGTKAQFLVTQIDLYKKHDNGTNSLAKNVSDPGVRIKSTKFQYDYSTCKKTPNNIANYYTSIPVSGVPYYWSGSSATNVETGKATLRKVQHIAYDATGTTPVYLPSYEFSYWGDGTEHPEYNPDYDPDRIDQWGNYMANSRHEGNNGVNYYHHYTELTKAEADKNAYVYNIREIQLPSGGSMLIDYEARSYGYVEDQKPYVMRKIIAKDFSPTHTKVTVDISDFETGKDLESEKILKVGSMVYGEMAFYNRPNESPLDESKLFIAGVDSMIVDAIASRSGNTQEITLSKPTLPSGNYPFQYEVKQYMYTESFEMRSIKEAISDNCDNADEILAKYYDMEKDGPLDAARKIVTNVRNLFVTDDNFESRFDGCYGTPGDEFYSHLSFLRTPAYKGKYTGCAVKSIRLKDNFVYGSQGDDDEDTEDNIYGTRYFYDENGDGSGRSAGVATIEPGGGKSCVIDVYSLTGAGFAPSPSIISSKTTMENVYVDEDDSDNITPRKKGKTTYEFYTAKDEGMQFRKNFTEGFVTKEPGKTNGRFYLFGIWSYLRIPIKMRLPIWLPITVKWDRQDHYNLKSYAYTDNTDIFGRPRSIIQSDASGQVVGKQAFTYYGMDEPLDVFKDGFDNKPIKKPGKMDQVWSEAHYTKKTNVNIVPWLLYLGAKSERVFNHTNMKYSYIPPVLKDVSSTMDGLETKTINTGFDYYTGSPLEVRSKDSYNNTKIIRTVPAYWKYPLMGPSNNNENNVNNLTATTGTYMYLNQVDNSHLIGAGIVEWSGNSLVSIGQNTWDIIDYLQPQKIYDSGSSTYKYQYNLLPGSSIETAYTPAARIADKSVGVNRKGIVRNSILFKTYKGYTYEVDLNSDGTFKSFTDFNYAADNLSFGAIDFFTFLSGYTGTLNPKWKLLSTNQLYSQNGVLVQSKDVLNNYATQLLGYHFSNTIGAVSNASWAFSAYDGAENTYQRQSTGAMMLEGDKVKLENAQVVEACQKTFTGRSLQYSSFPLNSGATSRQAHMFLIKPPTPKVYGVPFAKVDVVYSHNTSLMRTFYISLKDNGDCQVISDMGEDFTGFYTFKLSNGDIQLLFNPNDFTSFTVDNTFASHGFEVTTTLSVDFPDCELVKAYKVPNNNCISEVHTGSYAFALKPANTGTSFSMTANTILDFIFLINLNNASDEFNRKYKALVWVHNSSPEATELVAQLYNSSGGVVSTKSTSKATPYAEAGNWKLLRLDFDFAQGGQLPGGSTVKVFMKNASAQGTAIYDDLRVLPYHADMTNWVFEHTFNRVISGLDNDNFASFSAYDPRGRVTESAVELQDEGKRTVQKFLYNDQKSN